MKTGKSNNCLPPKGRTKKNKIITLIHWRRKYIKKFQQGRKPNSNSLWNTSLKSRHRSFIHSEEKEKWDSDRDGPYSIGYETGRIQSKYRTSSDTNRQ
jgi:hypothetical protein